MKQKKRSGLSRITAFLLVMLLAVNLVIPGFAATDTDYPYLYWDDTKTFETGVLNYDYDKIPKYMLDSMILRALEFTGYDVQFLKENKLLFHPDYVGAALEANQYLLRDDPILTEIGYSTQGSPGGSVKTAETDWEKAWTVTGRVPNIPTHIENGMSCTSFIEYFYFAYLPNCEGKDVSKIISMYNIAHDRVANKTGTYPDTWTEIFEGKGGLISQGLADHYEIELSESQDQTAEYNAIWRDLHPGAVIRFGNESSPYVHYAIYAGTYNNLHYVIHVGNGRGPEIRIAETLAVENSSKKSWPIDFYDLKLEQKYGVIQVVKADADDDTKLAGAKFIAINTITGMDYTIGPTNEYGYAISEEIPLGTYNVVEVVAPMGYALDPTVHEVVLSEEDSFATLYREIVNKKSYGSLQIQKGTNTGNNKAGWQFNVYKNSPVYSTAMNLESSGQMFRVTVSDYKGNSVTSDAVSMTTTPLKILRQPKNAVVEAGENVSYTVVAQGEGLTYLWQYKNPGKEWTSSTSADGLTHTYSYTMRTDRDGRLSRCIITDKYGNSVTTDEVFMVLPSTLAVVTDPVNTTTAVGQTVTMAVTASGSNVNYQWQYSTNGTTWYNCTTSNHAGCSGATTATLKFTGNAAYDGRMYRCQVTDGTETLYSGSATSTIVTAIINTQPQTQIAALGNSVTFSIGATGSGLTYTWQGKARGSSSWTTLGSGTSYTTTLTEANEGMEIRCVISKSGKTVISDSAYLATATTLLITNQPQNHVDEEGTYATFEVEAQGVGLTYVWETSTDGGNTWTKLTTPINDTPYVTDANGEYLISSIQTGDYFVQEIDTGKDGWEYDLVAKPVTVTADHTATAPAIVQFTNNEMTGGVYIDKYTEDGENYEGWEFAIYSDAGCTNLIAGPKTTDTDGYYLFEGLTPGTYWVKELGHIDPAIDELYYCASENPQKVTVEAGEIAYVNFDNNLNRGSIEIIKEDDKTSEKLSGAIFQAEDSNGNIFTFTESVDKPGYYYLSNVPYDTYTIVETQTPDGYKAGSETKWTVTLNKNSPNAQESITIVNVEILGGMTIKKTTEDSLNLNGWIFYIYADEECSTLVDGPYYTDDGGLIPVEGLKPGTYWVREEGNINADIANLYYCNSKNPQSVEVVDGGSDTVTFENKLKYGKLEIHKETNTGDRKDGWKFHVFFVSEDGVQTEILNSPFTTPADGILLIEKLIPGKYIVTEEQSGSAYWSCDVATLETTVQAGQTTDPLVFINTVKGLLQVKKETTDGSSVAGYKFNIYGPNDNLISGSPFTTDENGYITGIDYVLPGMYIVEEVLPADSAYEVVGSNRQTLEIKPEEVTTFTFVNAPKVGTLEIQKETNTGKNKGGWKVNVYRGSVAEENLLPGSPFTTDDQYGKIVISDLPIGIYIAVEVDDGKEMWVYDLKEKTVEVPHNGTGYITITNTHKGYGQIIKTTTNNGTKVGWLFEVWQDGAEPITVTTIEGGVFDLGLLDPGTYYVKEIGHVDMTTEQLAYWIMNAETKALTIEAGETRSVTFDNQWIGKGQIIKTTVNGGSAVGWQFKVWQDGTEPITVTTIEGGVFDLGSLEPGTYYVQEVGHDTYDLRYWIMDTEVKTLTVEAGKTSSVTFENIWMGELVIDKQAINSDLLAGWTGDLYLVNPDRSETKIGTYTSNENGRFAELLVAPGKYIFRETGHSDSSIDLTYWVMAGDKEIVVTAGTTSSATIINTELGYGQIIKDTTNGGIKEGWQFNVWSDSMETITVTTNANGEYNLELLAPGTYYVQEIGHANMTTEQLAYWVMDSDVKALEVKAGSTASVRFENQWQGMGRIKKEMPDGGSVAGWIFDVYRVSDNAYIGEFTSEENGDIALGYLIPGDYRVIERVPEGSLYLPVGGNEKILTVVAGEVKSLTFRNVLRSGEIILNKLDTSNDKALASAKFLLEWLDNDIWTPVVFSDTVIPGGCRSEGLVNGCLVTGENGQIIFEGLHPDLEYRLTEVEAPDGYSLQAAPVFEGKLPADTLSTEVTAYNSGIIVSPPTGVDAHFELLILFSAIVVILFFAMVALAIKEGMLTEFIRKHRE